MKLENIYDLLYKNRYFRELLYLIQEECGLVENLKVHTIYRKVDITRKEPSYSVWNINYR